MEDAVKLSTYPEFKIEFNTLSSMSITSRKISCKKKKKKKKKGTSTFEERVIQLFDSNYYLLLLWLCLFRVSDFPENTYFPEMLFSGKENSFKCLVVF